MESNHDEPLLDTDGENRAVRWFLAAYGGGIWYTVGNMKTHLRSRGYPYWPSWADEPGENAQLLTKGGAQLWLRYLFDLEKPAAQDAERKHLTDEQIERDRPMMVEPAAYAAGIRYAEKYHGIAAQQGEKE